MPRLGFVANVMRGGGFFKWELDPYIGLFLFKTVTKRVKKEGQRFGWVFVGTPVSQDQCVGQLDVALVEQNGSQGRFHSCEPDTRI